MQNKENIINKLSQDPPIEWVKSRWVKNNGVDREYFYLPIEKVEFILDELFTPFGWSFKVQSIDTKFSDVTIIGHLVIDHDGFKCKRAGVASETGFDLNNNAIPLKSLMPQLLSEAIPNAAKHLGRIFGASLNRDEFPIEKKPLQVLTNGKSKERLDTGTEAFESVKVSLFAGDITVAEVFNRFELSNDAIKILENGQ